MSLTVFELMATSRPVARPAHGGKITNGKKFCCRELGGGGNVKSGKYTTREDKGQFWNFVELGGMPPLAPPRYGPDESRFESIVSLWTSVPTQQPLIPWLWKHTAVAPLWL